jgi:hypothetical protein
VDGKVDWMAFGLPVEGDEGPFLGEELSEVATCDVTGTVADARRELERADDDVVIVVAGDRLAVGEVDSQALEGQADDVQLLDVLRPVPSTVRPSVTVASVAEAGGGSILVTDSDGHLLGRAVIEDDEHDHHHDHKDHEGHDHGEVAFDEERYEQELTSVLKAVEERFGDREPSAEELRAFLHERLVAEGRSAEEADEMLEQLTD